MLRRREVGDVSRGLLNIQDDRQPGLFNSPGRIGVPGQMVPRREEPSTVLQTKIQAGRLKVPQRQHALNGGGCAQVEKTSGLDSLAVIGEQGCHGGKHRRRKHVAHGEQLSGTVCSS